MNKQTINDTDIATFNEVNTNNILSSYLHYSSTPGYCYMLVPNNTPQPTLFRNSNESCSGFSIPFLKLVDLNIIDSDGNVVIYCVYRSFVSTKSSVDVWICD